MPGSDSKLIDVGRIAGVYGIKGWLKVQSFTQPADNLFDYYPWWLKTPHGVKQVEVGASRPHGKGYVVQLKGIGDRDVAAQYTGQVIAVEREQLPALEAGDYYWHQLQGLQVISHYQGQPRNLGRVAKLLETGANDVLVVAPDAESIDQRERLVPYVPEQYVLSVDLAAGRIGVDWDPEF
jgi:16S rRNA processing protein RimM